MRKTWRNSLGKPSRDKGLRREREVVRRLASVRGVEAERVPLSGAGGGSFAGDVLIRVGVEKLYAEVKARADGSGFKQIKKWMGDNDFLFLVEDRAEPLVAVPWKVFSGLLEGYARGGPLDIDGARDEEE
jgi:Holliday junction resolvase